MTVDEYRGVLIAVALEKVSQAGLPASNKQMGVVASLFRQFWEEGKGEAVFAAGPDWFRHQAMQLLWGRESMKELDMATVSTTLDELGEKGEGGWVLSGRGRELLSLLWAELGRVHPIQVELW